MLQGRFCRRAVARPPNAITSRRDRQHTSMRVSFVALLEGRLYPSRAVVDYRFVTTWCLDAPIDRVFGAIDDAARWPQWWKGVSRADLVEPGDGRGLGGLWRFTWRSRLPYDLSFESRIPRREPPHLLEGTATGEL